MTRDVVAIIPARGGSKGIPRKNVMAFCGHPLLAWSIHHARSSGVVSEVLVSTDDEEIAEVARCYGAMPVPRPTEISGDAATSESALLHALEWFEAERGRFPSHAFFLQATSPLREPSELAEALAVFEREGYSSLFSASKLEDMLVWRREAGKPVSMNYDWKERKRRQDVAEEDCLWAETGSFYLFRPDLLRKTGNRLGGRIGFWPVELWKSFEIDSQEGFSVCESLMRAHGLDKNAPAPSARA